LHCFSFFVSFFLSSSCCFLSSLLFFISLILHFILICFRSSVLFSLTFRFHLFPSLYILFLPPSFFQILCFFICFSFFLLIRVCSWSAMIETGKSQVRLPMSSLNFLQFT
jgi:hypothetical protein